MCLQLPLSHTHSVARVAGDTPHDNNKQYNADEMQPKRNKIKQNIAKEPKLGKARQSKASKAKQS